MLLTSLVDIVSVLISKSKREISTREPRNANTPISSRYLYNETMFEHFGDFISMSPKTEILIPRRYIRVKSPRPPYLSTGTAFGTPFDNREIPSYWSCSGRGIESGLVSPFSHKSASVKGTFTLRNSLSLFPHRVHSSAHTLVSQE